VGFTAQQVRPLVGPAPRVAIFDYTGNGSATSMSVMHQYVVLAGLDVPCDGGAANDCAAGQTGAGGCNGVNFPINAGPGRVYDILCNNDFTPPYSSSHLGAGGYKLLWTPHWSTGSSVAPVLQTISDFVDAGNNLVGECQSIETLEGGNDGCQGIGASPGSSGTDFQTTAGLTGNENVNYPTTNFLFSNYGSPNMQIGDFNFALNSGCLTDWGPGTASAYKPGVTHFIQANGTNVTDVYTLDHKDNDPNKGLVVYLGGHDYSGSTGSLQIAGTRLVLNSLFNLGIGCASPNTPCTTGLLGVCAQGTLTCNPNGGLICSPNVQPGPEICDGLDNNCNGLVDENLSESCYTADAGTLNVGVCHAGTSVCSNGVWGPCQGQVTPGVEVCNGLDDNCNGLVDENLARTCYDGPPGTVGVGVCDAGVSTCSAGVWGTCVGEVLPSPEICDGLDNNCNGLIDEGGVCGACLNGQTQTCYDGPPATLNVGVCHGGTQACVGGGFGPCTGEVLPGVTQCNGKDNNCDGVIDTGPCPAGFQCDNGTCVPSSCGGELGQCPTGYICAATGCVALACGDAGTCPPGQICQSVGTCVDPCAGITCGTGSFCQGGTCVSSICAVNGCADAGSLCLNGQCVADPCTGINCPTGTFCRLGDCVQNCAYQSCDAGTACSPDGFCEPVCTPACAAGQVCSSGQCVTDPCAGITCGPLQVCSGGACVDNPCLDAKCPFGKCVGGQCQGTIPFVDGGSPPVPFDGGPPQTEVPGIKRGCGCGQSNSFEALALVALMGLFFTRGRRERAPAPAPVRLRRARAAAASLLTLLVGCGRGTSVGDAGPVSHPPPISCSAPATLCGTACVDLQSNLANCGACDAPCLVGYTCASGACLFANQNPYLSSVTPPVATAGGTVSLSLLGQGFAVGATVRLAGSGVPDAGIDGEHALSVHASGSATLDNLSLANALPAALEVRVLNPGRLVSNAQTFYVVVSGDGGTFLQPPVITTLFPNSAASGAVVGLTVSGSNFEPRCTATLSGGSLPSPQNFTAVELGTSSVYVAAFDLTGVSPGAYTVSVTTSAGTSGFLPFTVLPPAPVLISTTPSHAARGSQVSFTQVKGNNFTNASALEIVSPAGQPTAIPTVYVNATTLTAGPLDLSAFSVGNYGLLVQNPGPVDSNEIGFVVDSNDPTLVSATPGNGRQDQTVNVTLAGAGFQPAATVTVSSPSGAIAPTAVAATWVSGASLQLNGWVLGALPVGNYNLVVQNPGSQPSGAAPFAVLEGTALNIQITPTSARTNTVVNGKVTGQYLYPTSVVYVDGGSGNSPLPTVFDGGALYVTTDLSGVPTGTYGVTVVNPGPLVSAAVPFTVTP